MYIRYKCSIFCLSVIYIVNNLKVIKIREPTWLGYGRLSFVCLYSGNSGPCRICLDLSKILGFFGSSNKKKKNSCLFSVQVKWKIKGGGKIRAVSLYPTYRFTEKFISDHEAALQILMWEMPSTHLNWSDWSILALLWLGRKNIGSLFFCYSKQGYIWREIDLEKKKECYLEHRV